MVFRHKAGDEIRQRIIAAMRSDLGVSEQLAQPFVDSVMRCFSGEQLYFPAAHREYPVDEMRAALMAGKSVAAVVANFKVSRSKLHSLFPGGLPRSSGK